MFGPTLIVCLLFGCLWLADSFEVPTPQISVLRPRGIRFQIGQIPGVKLMAYHYSVNIPVPGTQAGQYNYDTFPLGGSFTHENRHITVNYGDTVHYWVYADFDNGQSVLGHHLLDQQWTCSQPPASIPTAAMLLPPTYGIRRSTSARPTDETNARPDSAYGVTSTAAADGENVSAAAPAPDSGGSLTAILLSTMTVVSLAALVAVLAVFFVRRAKRSAQSKHSPSDPPRPKPSLPERPTAFAQPWSTSPVYEEDSGYEDPDSLFVSSGARREAADTAAAIRPLLKGTRPTRAPTPAPHEYLGLVMSGKVVDGGYITPISEARASATPHDYLGLVASNKVVDGGYISPVSEYREALESCSDVLGR